MANSSEIRVSLNIDGIVQGVGFRPTVYKRAVENRLSGFVNNSSQGVLIEVQGTKSSISKFVSDLKCFPPPLAKIDSFNSKIISTIKDDLDFKIISSNSSGEKLTLISPDVTLCKRCINDLTDIDGRRYGHPFTNCTDCGPRYSIIQDRPYDRPNTSMNSFEMCQDCMNEYMDPMDRRFHAQPNGCKVCGPKVYIIDQPDIKNVLEFAVEQIKLGKILALKGLGGFNLICDPLNNGAVHRLRVSKHRPNKSFALMMDSIRTVDNNCYLDVDEAVALKSTIAPIVLLKKRNGIFNHLSPDNNRLGVMLPYTPLHYLLMRHFKFLVMTSANMANEPIAIDDSAVRLLIEKSVVDLAISHDREIINRSDDSIIQFIKGKKQVIRRSRGFVPTPFYVKNLAPLKNRSLGLGANYKNCFTLRKGRTLFVSSHIGDLTDVRNFEFQNESIKSYSRLLDISPEEMIGDAHPGLENFEQADRTVFHHHAHMLSCMVEHDLLGESVLGVICDGMGYGRDGNIWGFEFLTVTSNYKTFSRVGSLDYFSLPGGDKSQREIDRIGISLLRDSKLSPEVFYESSRVKLINSVLKNNSLSPLTSSLGRLFDGVASLLNITQISEYEARGAIMLEACAELYDRCRPLKKNYQVKIVKGDKFIIDFKSLINEIVDDLKSNISHEEIAYKFHRWIAEAIIQGIKISGYKKIVFSGGCFQNKILVELLILKLSRVDVIYYFNNDVPINDAGISVGQVVV